MKKESSLTFHCDGEPLVGRTVILTGVGRSGTTILGNILGSLARAEYDFEPLILHTIPMFYARGEISKHVAIQMLRGYANEILTSNLLGRNVNVRPTDDSRIWNRLAPDEVMRRWYSPPAREEVKKFSLARKSILVTKSINLMAFYGLLYDAFTDCRIIHIVRHPYEVASSVVKRGWMSTEKVRGLEDVCVKKEIRRGGTGKVLIVPWWVRDEDVDDFFAASEFERALYYWWVLLLDGQCQAERLRLKGSQRYLELRYEELLADPKGTVEKAASFMGTQMGVMTESLIKSVRSSDRPDRKTPTESFPLDKLNPRWREKLFEAMEKFGYLVSV